eukprot:scpid18653/ scgid18214/ DENN domain-containing protein 1A; Connecdenn
MDSRIALAAEKLYEAFLEVEAPLNDQETANIVTTFPDESECDSDTINQAPWFCYACKPERGAVQHFSFVLTGIDGKFRFGFCRYPPDSSLCLCFVSLLPWFEFFYNILDKVAELRLDGQGELVVPLLKSLYQNPMPAAGERYLVIPDGLESGQAFSFQTPDPQKLSSIPESINLTEYITNIDPVYILHLFAAMLFERRIIITSSKLSLVSACVHGAASLLYPLNWQHIFVPIMPTKLIDYCCAPMPFLVGVHSSVMAKIRKMPLDEVVVLDADANTLEIYHDDLSLIPPDVIGPLKDTLKKHTSALDETVAKAFLDAFVYLIGGYRDALRFREGEQIKFDAMAFIDSRPKQMQPFLQKVLHLQQFQQFMMERLHRLNQGQGLRDVFENAITSSSQDSTNYLNKYALWVRSKTKRGFSEISSMTSTQVLPSMKTAFSHIHSRTKKGVKGLKQLMNDEKSGGNQQMTGMSISSPQLESKKSLSVSELLSSLPADSTIRKQVQSQRPKKPPPVVRPYSEYRATKTPSVSSGGDVIGRGNFSAPTDSPLDSVEAVMLEDLDDQGMDGSDQARLHGGIDDTVTANRAATAADDQSDDSHVSSDSPAVDDLLGLSVTIPSRSQVTCLAKELFLNFDPVTEPSLLEPATSSSSAATALPATSVMPTTSAGSSSSAAASSSEAGSPSPVSSFDPFHSPRHVAASSTSDTADSSSNTSGTSSSKPSAAGYSRTSSGKLFGTHVTGIHSTASTASVSSTGTSSTTTNTGDDEDCLEDFSSLARQRAQSMIPPSTSVSKDARTNWRAKRKSAGGTNGSSDSSASMRYSYVPPSSSTAVVEPSDAAADGHRQHPRTTNVSRAPMFTATSSPSRSHTDRTTQATSVTPFDTLTQAPDYQKVCRSSTSSATSSTSTPGYVPGMSTGANSTLLSQAAVSSSSNSSANLYEVCSTQQQLHRSSTVSASDTDPFTALDGGIRPRPTVGSRPPPPAAEKPGPPIKPFRRSDRGSPAASPVCSRAGAPLESRPELEFDPLRFS